MAKPVVPPDLLKAISVVKETGTAASAAAGKRREASPRTGATEKQSIRPARTAIAHQRGGNKGK
jgi:hypothetical protein